MARSIVNQDALIKLETVPGTPNTTGMKRLAGLRLRPMWTAENQQFRSTGSKVVDTVQIVSEGGGASVEGAQDFNALTYILASRFGLPTTSTPAGGTLTRDHYFYPTPVGADSKGTFTINYGDDTQAVQLAYAVFNMLGLTVQRGNLGLTASLLSKQPTTGITMGNNEVQSVIATGATAGTFTLTRPETGQTTAVIAFNANAAAVQTALEAIYGVGNVVTAGGALPGTAVTVTFQGAFARREMTLMTADNTLLVDGTAVVTTTTTPPTTVESVPIPARGYDIYGDDTWAAMVANTTKLLECYEANATFGDKFVPDRPINSTITSFESLLEGETQEHTGSFRLGFGTVARAWVDTTWTNGAIKFLKWKVAGPVIEGALTYLFELGVAIRLLNPGELSAAPSSPALTLPFEAVIVRDPTTGNFAYARLRNTVVTL